MLSGFKFIGVFILLLGGVNLKVMPLTIVFGSIILSSLNNAMFHDLITWSIFLLAVLSIKYKPSITVKGLFAFGFVLLIVIIQQLKGIYRNNTTEAERGIESFEAAYNKSRSEGKLFKLENIAESNVRINQGFIITNIMHNVPANIPFSNGSEMRQVLEAAFLPRILAPDKLKAGDREGFRKYTGMALREDTSMSLGALGDAYVNFGTFGGSIFMFLFGCLFNSVLNGFDRFGKKFPVILLFIPLVFYFPIRPDTALQTGLGHLVKACVLIYMMVIFWKKDMVKRAWNYQNPL